VLKTINKHKQTCSTPTGLDQTTLGNGKKIGEMHEESCLTLIDVLHHILPQTLFFLLKKG